MEHERECDECGKQMTEGYVIENGLSYFCTETCLHIHISEEEFLKLYADGEGDSYWTEWEK